MQEYGRIAASDLAQRLDGRNRQLPASFCERPVLQELDQRPGLLGPEALHLREGPDGQELDRFVRVPQEFG